MSLSGNPSLPFFIMSAPHYIDIPSLLSEEGGGFIVGVSGGIDSITLADILYRQGLTHFALAHCNFHLRGEESDGDAAFVEGWAEERGIKFLRADFDTAGYAARRGVSIEMAARELRYGWFSQLCRREGYRAVAIAHNANDNAETLLLNLVRGTGLRGICGMQTLSSQTVCSSETLCDALGCSLEELSDASLQIWRPLLQMTRRQIEGYALSHNLRWREDRTNADSRYKRNLIRNEVMPLLERLNPSVVKTLSRDMEHFSSAAAALEVQLGDFSGGLSDLKSFQVDDEDLAKSLQAEEESLSRIKKMVFQRSVGWKYALFSFLEARGFNPRVITQVEDLLESSRTRSGKVFLSPKYRLLMTRDSFILEPSQGAKNNGAYPGEGERTFPVADERTVTEGERAVAEDEASAIGYEIIVSTAGIYVIGDQEITVEIFDRPEGFPLRQPPGVTALDADKVPFPFKLRRWQRGDWMRPLGCRGRKKMSDLFTDLKFNSIEKCSALLLDSSVADSSASDPSHVLALVGSRVDESAKITPDTTRVLRLSF